MDLCLNYQVPSEAIINNKNLITGSAGTSGIIITNNIRDSYAVTILTRTKLVSLSLPYYIITFSIKKDCNEPHNAYRLDLSLRLLLNNIEYTLFDNL